MAFSHEVHTHFCFRKEFVPVLHFRAAGGVQNRHFSNFSTVYIYILGESLATKLSFATHFPRRIVSPLGRYSL